MWKCAINYFSFEIASGSFEHCARFLETSNETLNQSIKFFRKKKSVAKRLLEPSLYSEINCTDVIAVSYSNSVQWQSFTRCWIVILMHPILCGETKSAKNNRLIRLRSGLTASLVCYKPIDDGFIIHMISLFSIHGNTLDWFMFGNNCERRLNQYITQHNKQLNRMLIER